MSLVLLTALCLVGSQQIDTMRSVRAVVRFADGEALSRMIVDVGYRAVNSAADERFRYVQLQTDQLGEISFRLPRRGVYEVAVDAWRKPPRNDLPVNVWSARLDRVSPEHTELTFDCIRTAAVTVEVDPANPLPKELRFTLELRRQCMRHGRTIRRTEVGHAGGRFTFEKLTPGLYSAHLKAMDVPNMEWSRAVNVSGDPPAGSVTLPLPRLLFGSVLGKVKYSDGRPAANCRISVSPAYTHSGRQSKTDDQGRFITRLIPAGFAHVWASNESAEQRFRGHTTIRIRPGKSVSAGVIGLIGSPQPSKQRRLVSGTLRFADGTAIQSAGLGRRMGGGMRLFYPETTTDAAGHFHYGVAIPSRYVRFGLDHCPGWLALTDRKPPPRHVDTPEENYFARIPDTQQGPLQIEAELPTPGSGYGDITLKLVNFEQEYLHAAAVRIEMPGGQFRTEFPGGSSTSPENRTVRGMPPGTRHILLHSSVIGLKARATRTAGDEVVTVDGADSGSVVLHPSDEGHDIGYVLEGPPLIEPQDWAFEPSRHGFAPVIAGIILSQDATETSGNHGLHTLRSFTPQPAWTRLRDEVVPERRREGGTVIARNGTIETPRIASGRYTLHVHRHGTRSNRIDFEIVRGQNVHFDVVAAADSLVLRRR